MTGAPTHAASTLVIVHADVQVVPQHLDEALRLSREHVARSRAEPGCVSHAVFVDPDQPQRLVFVEEWQSEAALRTHFAVPESAAFVDRLAQLAASPPRIRLYHATDMPFPGPRS